MIDRLRACQVMFQLNTVTAINLRQIFLIDPNAVLLELNFFGD
ncbi:hypothetical protein [Novosphingobium aerophilum]|nr:hypothetical protein [Novosphingobium aerophilum]